MGRRHRKLGRKIGVALVGHTLRIRIVVVLGGHLREDLRAMLSFDVDNDDLNEVGNEPAVLLVPLHDDIWLTVFVWAIHGQYL
jgi:hypothetical protein